MFVDRLWKSVKYERVHLHAYDSVTEARASIINTWTGTIKPDHIRPIIRSFAETAKVKPVTIQTCLGFDNPASWLFSIETAENLYSFPEISLENVIDPDTARKTVSDWTRRSNEIKKTPLKEP